MKAKPIIQTEIEPRREYTTTEAAAILGLARISVRHHIYNEIIAAEKRGRDYSITGMELIRFQLERKPAGRPTNKSREREALQ